MKTHLYLQELRVKNMLHVPEPLGIPFGRGERLTHGNVLILSF